MYFILNVSGCPRIAAFPYAPIAKNRNLGCPRIAAFPSTLTTKKLELYFLALYSNFFYTQLAFAFHLQKDSYIVHCNIIAFCFCLLQKDFDVFYEPLCEAFPCSFDKIAENHIKLH